MKSQKGNQLQIFTIFLMVFFFPILIIGQCTINGIDLINSPMTSTFGATTTEGPNGSVQYEMGEQDEVITIVPILAPGELASGDSFSSSYEVEVTRISVDNDPTYGFTDGNAYAGLIANDGNRHFSSEGTISGGNPPIAAGTILELGICNGSCGSIVGDTYTIELSVSISAGVATITGTTTQGANTTTTSFISTEAFDPSLGISFILVRQSAEEMYQLNSATFQSGALICNPAQGVPTIGQWGILTLFLAMMIFSVEYIKQANVVLIKQ